MNTQNYYIADMSIFGVYKNAEDRLTAALLHVIRYLGHDLVSVLFDEFDLAPNDVAVRSQPKLKGTRPDGMLSCHCDYDIIIESKIVKNGVRQDQFDAQKAYVEGGAGRYLIYLTPDDVCPSIITQQHNIIWMSWDKLVEKLDQYKAMRTLDTLAVFLIDQLILMKQNIVDNCRHKAVQNDDEVVSSCLRNDGLEDDERVIIVGGAWGKPVANKYRIYACQPNRTFAPARYIAFYHKHRIEDVYEIIGDSEEAVDIRAAEPRLVQEGYFTDMEPNYNGDPRKLFRLGKKISVSVVNDKKDKNGKLCAFVQNQTYTSIHKITSAKLTSEL